MNLRRRPGSPATELKGEVRETALRRLEDARKVVETKLAWLERAENLAQLSQDVKDIGNQLGRLETMIMGLYAALEPRPQAPPTQTGELDRYCVRAREAAKFLGLAEATLAEWRMKGEGPQFVKGGPKNVLYRVGDLRAWVDQNVVTSTWEYQARERNRQ
jgi:predicted DNA-binding transcriptional regulator AlpA